ncbi:MAG: CRISPR system precrRNA processing endoribonuclease RAMP protein Cas6 [Candidatus Nezhaarchaeales archaeon]
MNVNLLNVLTEIKSDFRGYVFTGKLVKTILIKAIPQLEHYFKPSSEPKLIHISPLYKGTQDKKKCIYSYVQCKNSGYTIKCEGEPVLVHLNGSFYFYLGFHSSIVKIHDVVQALVDYAECFDFMNKRVCVRVLGVEFPNVHELGLNVAKKALESGAIKVVFSSPTMLRDPLRTSGKFKTLLPSPFNVFATPVYTILFSKGLCSVRRLRTELLRLHRLFNETYSVLGGLKIRWVYYSKRPEPALIGYVNYRVNYEYLDFLKQGLNVEEWLGEVFAYTLALGVGAGRATGFGHVEIKPLVDRGSSGGSSVERL